MTLTAPYGDCCQHCSDAGGNPASLVCWPYAATRDGGSIKGQYRCPAGHTWTCHWGIGFTEYR
jgi:hypothetical protein